MNSFLCSLSCSLCINQKSGMQVSGEKGKEYSSSISGRADLFWCLISLSVMKGVLQQPPMLSQRELSPILGHLQDLSVLCIEVVQKTYAELGTVYLHMVSLQCHIHGAKLISARQSVPTWQATDLETNQLGHYVQKWPSIPTLALVYILSLYIMFWRMLSFSFLGIGLVPKAMFFPASLQDHGPHDWGFIRIGMEAQGTIADNLYVNLIQRTWYWKILR